MWSYSIGILHERFKTSLRDKSYDKLICFRNICQLEWLQNAGGILGPNKMVSFRNLCIN